MTMDGQAGEGRIRAARSDDASAIEALVHRAYRKYLERMDRKPAPMTADYAELIARGGLWVLEVDGTLAGAILLQVADTYLHINNVAVSPDYQGRGLGARLLRFAENEARRRGTDELRLYTNEKMHENVAIYQRLGWLRYAEGEEGGFRRIFMKKTLDV